MLKSLKNLWSTYAKVQLINSGCWLLGKSKDFFFTFRKLLMKAFNRLVSEKHNFSITTVRLVTYRSQVFTYPHISV